MTLGFFSSSSVPARPPEGRQITQSASFPLYFPPLFRMCSVAPQGHGETRSRSSRVNNRVQRRSGKHVVSFETPRGLGGAGRMRAKQHPSNSSVTRTDVVCLLELQLPRDF